MTQETYPLAREYNFDGLAGPSHNYAGLSIGNKASMGNRHQASNPKKAGLEGLEKMKLLMDRGFPQALLPPQFRPDLDFLKKLGFSGGAERILKAVEKLSPALLASLYSSSSLWAANSATVSPRADTADGKTHFTPANLQTYLHRSLETGWSARLFKKIFPDKAYFTHHPPLPALPAFSDEGSANHSRLCAHYGAEGVEFFVYGREAFSPAQKAGRFPARQSALASKTVAFRHRLKPEKTVMARQNPQAVEAGVFHNDVAFAADQNLVFCHELAFERADRVLSELEKKLSPAPLLKILAPEKEMPLKEAVSSYLFNSQLLPAGPGRWALLAPAECEKNKKVFDYLNFLAQNSPIKEVFFVSVRQSMRNGGGPACLRLRVVLAEKEAQAIHQGVLLDQNLYERVKAWIEKHYRDRLQPKDLLDPNLIKESQSALDELSQILQLGAIYPFQN